MKRSFSGNVYHPELAARRLIAWVIAFTHLNHRNTLVALLFGQIEL
jgi:hypothetical protein